MFLRLLAGTLILIFNQACNTNSAAINKDGFSSDVKFIVDIQYVSSWNRWVVVKSLDQDLIPLEFSLNPNEYRTYEEYADSFNLKNDVLFDDILVKEDEVILSTGPEMFSRTVKLKRIMANDSLTIIHVMNQTLDKELQTFENRFYEVFRNDYKVSEVSLLLFPESKINGDNDLETKVEYGITPDTLYLYNLPRRYDNESIEATDKMISSHPNSIESILMSYRFKYILNRKTLYFEKKDSVLMNKLY